MVGLSRKPFEVPITKVLRSFTPTDYGHQPLILAFSYVLPVKTGHTFRHLTI